MKRILFLLIISLGLLGCETEQEPTTYTIASQMGAYKDPVAAGFYKPYNIIKENPNGKWIVSEGLYGMKPTSGEEYQLGYEYVVEGKLVTGEELWENERIADGLTEFTVSKVISKTLKETELPKEWHSDIATYEREFLTKE